MDHNEDTRPAYAPPKLGAIRKMTKRTQQAADRPRAFAPGTLK
jgi:hypothetical protein